MFNQARYLMLALSIIVMLMSLVVEIVIQDVSSAIVLICSSGFTFGVLIVNLLIDYVQRRT